MAERNVDAPAGLFADEAAFVHIGGTMSRAQELEVIKSGAIQSEDARFQEVSVGFVGTNRHCPESDPPRGRRRLASPSFTRPLTSR